MIEGLIQRGGGHWTLWFLPYNAACSDVFFYKDRSSFQYFITQEMGQSSIFLTFRTLCNFRERTSAIMKPA